MATRTATNFTAGNTLTAAQMDGLHGGWLGYASVTSGQTGLSSETALTGLSVTVTVSADRLIKVTGFGRTSRTVADGVTIGNIQQDGVTVGRWAHHSPDAASEMASQVGFVLLNDLAAGSYTFRLTLQRFSGTGTVGLDAASSGPAYILVEDIGPAS